MSLQGITTVAPVIARALADSNPMPEFAPVIIQTIFLLSLYFDAIDKADVQDPYPEGPL